MIRKTRHFLRARAAMLVLGVSAASAASPPSKLPVPCAPAACGSTGPGQWVTAGSATAVATQNALTVTQSSKSAVLNWSSFDIGANGSVIFKQPSASAVALNKIYQGSPSQIFGNLSANGQVYLINLNGFLFGPTATVNVGSLLVSSLPLTLSDANFGNGILSLGQSAAFDATQDPLAPGIGRASVLDANGNSVLDANGKPLLVQVAVQAGARITSADQGRILLTGQNVTNSGTLTSTDGQVILAAGQKVYLEASSDPGLRGLLVEVDPGSPAWDQLNGIATNSQGGVISTPRGNVTMVGLAVNQDGRVSATTSVSANGSIRLEAGSGHSFVSSGLQSTQGAQLTLGPQSEMDILPEYSSSATATAGDTQLPSTITLLGEQVLLQGGSITAPGGNLKAIAAANPAAAAAPLAPLPTGLQPPSGLITNISPNTDPNARLRIDSGTTIDLSGSSASLPVTANLVSAQLRSSELADDATQRNGPLHGLTVYFDARNPPPASLANVSGEIAAVPQTIAQRTENGGTALFESEGDAVLARGASVNVSGGATTYSGGVLQTSYLVGANGQLYPIASANPLQSYVGVANPTFTQTYNKWGVKDVLPTPGLSYYQPGYVQGAAAGTVQFAAPTLVLQGALKGSAVDGLYQRTPQTSAAGGTLIIGVPGGIATTTGAGGADFAAPSIQFTTTPTPIVVADDASLPGPLTLDLAISYLTGSGFTSTGIYSNSTVTLPAATPLSLPSGSTLSIAASRINILSDITDAGGGLSFQNLLNVQNATDITGTDSGGERLGVFVGDGVTLDVRGLWTNDMPAVQAGITPQSQTWQNGGSIQLGVSSQGALLSVGNDVSLRASGGGWMQGGGKLTPGSGGQVTLLSNAMNSGLDVGQNLAIDGFGVNGAAGGTFSLTAPRIAIGAGAGNWTAAQQVDDTVMPGGIFKVNAGLFSDFGFQKFTLTASGLVIPPPNSNAVTGAPASRDVLTVEAGTAIDATVSSLFLDSNAVRHASASSLDGIATITSLPLYKRHSATIDLYATPYPNASNAGAVAGQTFAGDVDIQVGSSIITDPLGSIGIQSPDSILLNGTLQAPGGSVSLQIQSVALLDVGFLPTQRIELGAAGRIDVSGTFVPQPSTLDLDLGQVYAGGSVTLMASRGAVVTDVGSQISVSGTSATIDILQANGQYGREVAATAGGSLTVFSGESISLLGTLQAAGGAGGTEPAVAGSLDVALGRADSRWATPIDAASLATFNPAPLAVEVVPSVAGTVAASFDSNFAALGAAQISTAGFDSVHLESSGVVEFSGSQFAGPVSLALDRQFSIDAPAIAAVNGAQAHVSAPYVQVGYTNAAVANASSASPGSGTLSFSGKEIDLVGTTVFQGTSKVSFESTGDLLLRGDPTGAGLASLQGGLTVVGALALAAERIYPVTATTFAIDANDVPSFVPGSSTPESLGTVTLTQIGANPGTPLSAGGNVAITASDISSAGTLYAPFGSITLQATDQLTLGAHSLTSVSGSGLVIPYGQTTLGGQQWIYETTSQPIAGVPARTVTLQSPSVTIAKQATVDLSGGGDLQAYEWVPGSGGTKDVLTGNPDLTVAGSGYTPGLYAILPSVRGGASPLDPLNAVGSTIPAGETVYLSGGGGLPAGTYTILPPRYALEPGAFLIQTEAQFQSTTAGVLGRLADGTTVVAGFLSYGTTGLHQSPGYVGFAVRPGSYGSQLAQYNLTDASKYFSAAATAAGAARPHLPADAGTLVLNVPALTGATHSGAASLGKLDLEGQVLTVAATGGEAAAIDILANDLVIGTTAAAASDAVTVAASVLNGWQPGSLLLGGCSFTNCPGTLVSQVTPPSTGDSVIVGANTVTIGAGSTLTAGEITLVANQAIDVQSGAMLQTPSASTGKALKTLPSTESLALLSPAGGVPGLLAVSDLNWIIPERTPGVSAIGAGTVAVDQGAIIASRGALTIDGVGGVQIQGSMKGPGAEWSLGSSSIAFVPAAGTPPGLPVDALTFDPALLSQLNTAAAVRLASSGAIDIMTPLTFGFDGSGNPALGSLTLAASTLNNMTGTAVAASATVVRFGAKTITLEGSGASSTTAATAGQSGAELSFNAAVLNLGPTQGTDLGPNQLAINGFANTQMSVSGAVIGQGSSTFNVGGGLAIASGGITAASGATVAVGSSADLTLSSAANPSKLPAAVGGALTLSGAGVDIGGAVVASSGLITVNSTRGDLTVDSGATLSTAGSVVSIQNQSVNTPGGSIILKSSGDLTLSRGATVDVSGAGTGAQQASAGSLSLTASGSAQVAANLKGAGVAGNGGRFSLDAGAIPAVSGGGSSLDALATTLGTGGFTTAIDVRARSGDLSLRSGSVLAANEVSLTADDGAVTVAGSIRAESASLRGDIAIFGGNGVEIASSGSLSANGIGASGHGGNIEIGAGHLVADSTGLLDQYNAAVIRLDAGSNIAASGASGMGTLLLRAPAQTTSSDVAIDWVPASTPLTVGRLIVEPVLPFNTAGDSNPATQTMFSSATTPTANDFNNVQQAVAGFMNLAGSNLNRLAPSGNIGFMIEPGVELIADGALTLQSSTPTKASSALDLSAPGWHFNGAPIDLTVRATGDLSVVNTVTDGFSNLTSGKLTQPVLLPGPSASIRLIAGADLSSADPLQALNGGTGTLTIGLAPPNSQTAAVPAVVRTGTGDINLVAAQDIVVNNTGSGAYTAGTPAIATGGTIDNPYPLLPASAGTTYVGTDPYGNSYAAAIAIPRVIDLLMSFPSGGGNLTVLAGGNIIGAPLSASGVPAWQLREGGGSDGALSQWGVNLAAYNWTFGTLGGGDLNIAAGGVASTVTAAAADSLLPQYGGGPQYVTGGGLSFRARGDIASTQVFLADGTGSVTSGGALSAVLPSISNNDSAAVGSAFYLQSSSLSVTARLGAKVDGVLNPTGFTQVSSAAALAGSYFSYSSDSSFNLDSLAGDIIFDAASNALSTLLGPKGGGGAGRGVLPGTLSVDALNGNIIFGPGTSNLTLFPSPHGQLDLVAAQDINDSATNATIILSDALAGSYPTAASPIGNGSGNVSTPFSGDLHMGDSDPARVTTGGSIVSLSLSIPKAGEVIAGKDITDLTYLGQNLSTTDQTVISAGRDLSYTAVNGQGIEVGGPGEVDVLAGRSISLGFSQGIATIGSLGNPNLPSVQGANITVATGLGTDVDYRNFLTKVIEKSATYRQELVSYVESLQGFSGLTLAAAEAAFQQFTQAQQRPLIDQVFFNELLLSGRAANATPSAGFSQGYAAIDTLFPGSRTASSTAVPGSYLGDLSLTLSRIYTVSGGDISLLVPGGHIDVGLAVVPPDAPSRTASQLGIVAEGAGNVDIYSKSDVNVNSSRIFTLGGGNILIWSDEGSIDAGRGSKTAISAPPPTVSIDSSGNVMINFGGAAEGSGIRTIQTDPSVAAGNVDLVAPVGTVNAGDAGIGAAGNINIAAASVLGVTNINFGGTATGVPATISSVGASLSGASAAASSASNTSTSAVAGNAAEKEAVAPLSQAALSWLDVFVTGLGEENCKPDDIDCLKRQKTAAH